MKTAIDLDNYAGKEEAVVARRLVRKALELGYSVSVYDGGEWTVKKSTNRMEILKALASTGMDTLKFRIADTDEVMGSMYLVYQNGPGDELINDYTANYQMETLANLANG